MSDLKNIKGGKELQAFLDQLPAKMEANVMRSALRKGAQVIAEEAKMQCPTDTGRLRDSIRVSVRLIRGKVVAKVSAGGATKKRVSSTASGGVKVAYDNAYYARFVEFGTAAHYIKAVKAKSLVLRANKQASSGFANRWMSWVVDGVEHPGARAKPFMRPAFDSKSTAALQAVIDQIRKRLTKQGINTADLDIEVEA